MLGWVTRYDENEITGNTAQAYPFSVSGAIGTCPLMEIFDIRAWRHWGFFNAFTTIPF
jgi:hypothetical protein